MKRSDFVAAGLAVMALIAPISAPAIAEIVTTTVVFPKGSTGTMVNGTIKGDQTRDYVVNAKAGQVMSVKLTGSSIVYFNVLPPGSNGEAIFTGSSTGNSFSGTLSQSGSYKIRVYQMRASARRGESGTFKLDIAVNSKTVTGLQVSNSKRGRITGIQGMDGVAAFDELRSRGFANVDSFSSGNTLYGIYYYSPTKLCVQTTSADGKILDVRDIKTHPKCV